MHCIRGNGEEGRQEEEGGRRQWGSAANQPRVELKKEEKKN